MKQQSGVIEVIILLACVVIGFILAGGLVDTNYKSPVDPTTIVSQTLQPATTSTNPSALQMNTFAVQTTYAPPASVDMQYYITTYHFVTPDQQLTIDPATLQRLQAAYPYALAGVQAYNTAHPSNHVDLPLVLWWYGVEVGRAGFDFWTFSYCPSLGGSQYSPTGVCPDTSSGAWQLGMGHQFAGAQTLIDEAVQNIYGAGYNLQSIASPVTQKIGSSYIPPATVGALNTQGISIISRDPKISAYIDADALSPATVPADPKGKPFGLGSYSDATWQVYSDYLNAVLNAWPQISQ